LDALQHTLRRGHAPTKTGVDFNGCTQRPRQSFKAALDDVVRVLPIEVLHMQAEPTVAGKGMEPLFEKFCVHLADFWPLKRQIPNQIGPVI
jgi:hypothetical protein